MGKKIVRVILKDEGIDENSGVMTGPVWVMYKDGTQKDVEQGSWLTYPVAKALAKKLNVPFETV
jgi:hypothetical protein